MEFKNNISIVEEDPNKFGPVVLLIELPEEYPNVPESGIEIFGKSFIEIKKKYPGRIFQFIPHTFELSDTSMENKKLLNFAEVTSYFAISQ
jgi:hypothetical protein